jgi:S-adenosylmethionine uptake transporter
LYGHPERQGPLLASVLASFAGVIMILRPTLDQNQLFAGLVGLLSGMGAALAYLQVTALGKMGEPEARTVFYFALCTAAVGLASTLVDGFTPWAQVTWQAAAWLVPIGVLASLGQWCMTRAYSRGPTMLVANLQYSGIVFAAMYGLILFGDQIALVGWAGIALIVGSGLIATVLRSRMALTAPAQDP